MSKLITMTEEMMEECRREFANSLQSAKLFDGKVKFNKIFTSTKQNERATIIYTSQAWAKVVALLDYFNKEVAWHGVVERVDCEEAVYIISDIVVYPQSVTGATVSMNEETYAKWLMDNYEDERFNHLRMQGHSHVDMATSPSGVDLTHQEEILRQLGKNDFYIFMIYNKKHQRTSKIYDLKRNTLYEEADITVRIEGFDDFLECAKALVVETTLAVAPPKVKNTRKSKPKAYLLDDEYADWYSGGVHGMFPGGEI